MRGPRWRSQRTTGRATLFVEATSFAIVQQVLPGPSSKGFRHGIDGRDVPPIRHWPRCARLKNRVQLALF